MDGFVFDYWRANADYRPKNLREWANRFSSDPTDLRGAVMASDPGRGVDVTPSATATAETTSGVTLTA